MCHASLAVWSPRLVPCRLSADPGMSCAASVRCSAKQLPYPPHPQASHSLATSNLLPLDGDDAPQLVSELHTQRSAAHNIELHSPQGLKPQGHRRHGIACKQLWPSQRCAPGPLQLRMLSQVRLRTSLNTSTPRSRWGCAAKTCGQRQGTAQQRVVSRQMPTVAVLRCLACMMRAAQLIRSAVRCCSRCRGCAGVPQSTAYTARRGLCSHHVTAAPPLVAVRVGMHARALQRRQKSSRGSVRRAATGSCLPSSDCARACSRLSASVWKCMMWLRRGCAVSATSAAPAVVSGALLTPSSPAAAAARGALPWPQAAHTHRVCDLDHHTLVLILARRRPRQPLPIPCRGSSRPRASAATLGGHAMAQGLRARIAANCRVAVAGQGRAVAGPPRCLPSLKSFFTHDTSKHLPLQHNRAAAGQHATPAGSSSAAGRMHCCS